MAIVMLMNWEGVTPENYEALRKDVNWEGSIPAGAIFHVAAFDDKGIRVTDLWDKADDFNNFVEKRLMPGVQKLGVTGEPKIEIYPVHATFTPGYNK